MFNYGRIMLMECAVMAWTEIITIVQKLLFEFETLTKKNMHYSYIYQKYLHVAAKFILVVQLQVQQDAHLILNTTSAFKYHANPKQLIIVHLNTMALFIQHGNIMFVLYHRLNHKLVF